MIFSAVFISSIRTVHSEMTSTQMRLKKNAHNVLKKQKFFDGSRTANRTQSHFYLSMPMNMKQTHRLITSLDRSQWLARNTPS